MVGLLSTFFGCRFRAVVSRFQFTARCAVEFTETTKATTNPKQQGVKEILIAASNASSTRRL